MLSPRKGHSAARVFIEGLVLHNLLKGFLHRGLFTRDLQSVGKAGLGTFAAGDAFFAVEGMALGRNGMKPQRAGRDTAAAMGTFILAEKKLAFHTFRLGIMTPEAV